LFLRFTCKLVGSFVMQRRPVLLLERSIRYHETHRLYVLSI
jgi:hypothetical protein